MREIYGALIAALTIFTTPGSAFTSVVTFEGLADASGGQCVNTQIDSEGLSFNTGFFQCARNTATGGTDGKADNGTDFLMNGFSDHTVTATNGSPFDLLGLDLGISFFNSNITDHVTLTAFFHGGGMLAQSLVITQPNFTTHALSLLNLDSFTISVASDGDQGGSASYPGYVAVDNIVFAAIPEPSKLALFSLGLAALGFSRRRKSANKS